MPQPNQAAPAPAAAAPKPGQAPAKPAAVDPKAAAAAVPAAPAVPAAAAPAVPEVRKPQSQIEQELSERFAKDGIKWDEINPKVRENMVAAELKSREADKRMQLAAKLKKDLDMTTAQANQLIEALKKDPWGVLSNPALGHDVRKMAEEYVWNQIQQQRMTPEQRRAAAAERELAEYKAREEQAKKDQAQKELDELTKQRREHWEKTIQESMEAEKLPKITYVVRRYVDYIRAAVKSKVPANMPAIAKQIKEELVSLQSQYLMPPKFQNETDEQYEERLLSSAPNDFVKMIRKADLRKLRAKGLAPKPGPKPAGQAPAPAPSKKKLMSEWIAERDQRMGRK